MLASLKKRTEREDEGFTLIELMVVVLIIAILLAIAIPTFLGARERAQARSAQSNARNAITAAKTHFTDNNVYGTADTDAADADSAVAFKAIEPSLEFVARSAYVLATADDKDVAVDVINPFAYEMEDDDSDPDTPLVRNEGQEFVGGGVCVYVKGKDQTIYGIRELGFGTGAGVAFAQGETIADIPCNDEAIADSDIWKKAWS